MPGQFVGKTRVEDYIANHICLKSCKEYRENLSKPGKHVCVCGRQRSWHEEGRRAERLAAPSSSIPVYGNIQFRGFGKHCSQQVQYVKVDQYTGSDYIDHVWRWMVDYWQLPQPKLIIGVSGGAKKFDLNSRLSNALKKGLVNSAAKTGAWLMTGGTKTGVRELVGEAVRDYYYTPLAVNAPVVCIGMVTWGVILNKEALVSKDGRGCFPAVYKPNGDETKWPAGMVSLDPNHTHFIFVDKGESKEINNDVFKASLMNACMVDGGTSVCEDDSNNFRESLRIPSLTVVINGGLGTVESVYKYVKELCVPVVVVSGSGRAADFVALACSKVTYDDQDEVTFSPDFDEVLTNAAYGMFDWSNAKDSSRQQKLIAQAVENCRGTVKCRRYLTIFHTDSEYNSQLDNAILDALMKANKTSLNAQLHLALSWNQTDVAKEKIFTVDNKNAWKTKDHQPALHAAMFQALCKNQLQFVELLVDNGVEWESFLTVQTLRDLYNEMVLEGTYESSTGELLKDILFTKIMFLGSYSCCGQGRVDVVKSNLLTHIGELMSYLFNYQIDNFYKAKEYKIPKSSQYEEAKEVVPRHFSPMRELFLWAVLLNRKQLAMLFWRHCDCNIVAAQLGSVLLTALSEIAASHVETEQSAELKQSAWYFENLAVGVLNESYSADKSLTHRLLVRRCPVWGSNTVFSTADSGEQMDIMAQSACQTKLGKIWMGRMVNDTPMYKIITTMFFPPMLLWIKFAEQPWKPEDMRMVKGALELLGDSDNKVLPEEQEMSASQTSISQKSVYQVRCCAACTSDEATIGFLFAYYYFLHAPVVKFCFQNLLYVGFVLLFSYFVTVELRPFTEDDWVAWPEFVIWITAVTQVMEELRQLVTEENLSIISKVSTYFSSAWNMFDMLAHLFLAVSIVLRFTVPPEHFLWVRITYGVTLVCYILRFMQTFFVSQDMGPKIVMIRRMVKDLLFFMGILFLFILCYGVVLQAVRFPNSTLGWPLIRNVLFVPYFNIYGELFLEDLQGDIDCTTNKTALTLNSDLVECPQTTEFVTLLLAGYMLMSNILLVNLLIAMFSYTFEQIQENSEKVWRFFRYSLIYEFYDRPVFAPPFIVLSHIWRLILATYRLCRKLPPSNTEFRMALSDNDSRQLDTFEKLSVERYLHTLYLEEKNSMSARLSNTQERIEKVFEDFSTIKEKIGQTMKTSESQQSLPSKTPAYDSQAVGEMKSDIVGLKSEMNKVLTLLEQMNTRLTGLAPPTGALYQSEDDGSPVRPISLHRRTSVNTFAAP